MSDALRARLATVTDLQHAAAVLDWDQETYMPPGGAEARARQTATLRRLAHETLTADETGALLDAAAPETETERALVDVVRRDRARALCLPASFVEAQAAAQAEAMEAWKHARAADDFASFAPHLERLVGMAVEEADRVAPTVAEARGPGYAPTDADRRYDALLDLYEPGAQAAEVTAVFRELLAGLVPLVSRASREPAPDDVLRAHYDATEQWRLSLDVAAELGYSFAHGRLDRSAHPFSTSFSSADARITTRVDERFFPTAFFGTVHEVGHALYEQGFAPDLDRTPLAAGASLGLHESQSRLWENLVGRSPAFWRRWFPNVQRRFPDALGGVSEAAFLAALHRVEPSLIRVEADELTYHLHVLLRFETERALLAGTLAVRDVPEAWNERMRQSLGIVPPTDADGCLQDVHWSMGAFGYFPTYTLGTLMSVQLWNAMERDLGGLDARVEAGDYASLLGWLREHVHRWGRVRTAGEILTAATGERLSAAPWLAYAEARYGAS